MASLYGVEPAPSPTRSDRRLDVTKEGIVEFAKTATLIDRPELVFAFVRTLGSKTQAAMQELKSNLRNSGFDAYDIKLSSLLDAREFEHEADRYNKLMTSGNRYRAAAESGDAVARLAVRKIISRRQQLRDEKRLGRVAWIIDSLMHPKEVELLRGVYGPRLFVIACDAPRHERHSVLKQRFAQRSGLTEGLADSEALRLINRDAGLSAPDEEDVERRFRLSTSKTMELADVFVRTDSPNDVRSVIRRLVQCVFGHPFHTPTPDEFGMAVAFQAALTTATLSRRVGAAIVVNEQIVAVGVNEVPKAGGHVYSAESEPDGREWVEGVDPSDGIRAGILSDLLRRLKQQEWLSTNHQSQGIQELTTDALRDSELTSSQLFDVIEYSRTAHAEMVAITGAARIGVSIAKGTLYTTTLPCHECTRNIIAAGIDRVVYVEPYPKSRGAELQSDSMVLVAHHGEHARKIAFELFSGISYRRFPDLFSWVPRKNDDFLREAGGNLTFDGNSVNWMAYEASIRPSILNPDFADAELLSQAFREYQVVRDLPGNLEA